MSALPPVGNNLNEEPDPAGHPAAERPSSPLFRVLVIVGGIGLLFAMAVDAVAVVGRHIGLPLLGSIELVQAGTFTAASAALLVATIERTHAVVHLVIDRSREPWKTVLLTVNRLLSAAFFLMLTAGSAWLAFDLWGGHEESELVRIPYAPLRIAAILSCLAVAITFLIHAIRREERS